MNNAADIWASVLDILRNELGLSTTTINTWFVDARAVSFENDSLVIETPTPFKKGIITEHYKENVEKALLSLFSVPIKFEVFSSDELEERDYTEDNCSFFSEYTFEKFIVGDSNKFAHAAAKAVALAPGRSYNPLLIHGMSGLGKTHLLLAIACEIKKSDPKKKITYVKGEEFTNELIESIRKNTRTEFKNKYRTSDVLLVDDVQFIAGKDSTQEEFFHTFNALHEARHQIVLTSDRPPSEMATLEERLRSRFQWGLTTEILPPDFETRMAIISLKASALGLNLTTPQKEIIANNVTANVRQLEGTVNKLLAFRDLLSDEVQGVEVAERAIRDIFAENPWINPTPEFIIKAVAKYFKTDADTILGKNRSQEIVNTRKTAIFMVNDMTDLSSTQIAKIFNRDHSTILHSIKSLKEELNRDPKKKEQLQDVKNSILDP